MEETQAGNNGDFALVARFRHVDTNETNEVN